MLLQFQFGFGATPSAEVIAAMQPFVREPLKPEETYRTYTGQFPELFSIVPKDVELRMHGEALPMTTFEVFMDRLIGIEKKLDAAPAVNARCNVVLPGVGTLLFDEVQAVTDTCTEALQTLLDAGWRILAICVQPNQRRPDYILARTRGALHA